MFRLDQQGGELGVTVRGSPEVTLQGSAEDQSSLAP